MVFIGSDSVCHLKSVISFIKQRRKCYKGSLWEAFKHFLEQVSRNCLMTESVILKTCQKQTENVLLQLFNTKLLV